MSREHTRPIEAALPTTGGPVRVLLVDDQAPFRAAARSVVELTDGFEIVGEAHTGEAAVEAARALLPHLILMDVNLPGIDGAEASRRILATHHAGATGPRPAVVLLSTYEAAEYAPRAPECGAVAYLPKAEFDRERLVQVWRSAAA